MTSAQNHQRLLNGNKRLGLILLFTLACISCGAFKSNSIDVEEYHDKKEDSKEVEKTLDTKVVKKEEKKETKTANLVEVYFHDEKFLVPPQEDRDFSVALVLPFMAQTESNGLTNPMLDFMEGIQLALEDLEQKGMLINVRVYDSKRDSNAVKKLLLKEEFKYMDLIIGPVFEENLNLFENHCAMYHIPLIVPLKYYSKKTNTDFPLFNVFPTDSVFYYSLGRNIALNYKNHKVSTVSTSDKSSFNSRKFFTAGYKSVRNTPIGNVDAKNCLTAAQGDSAFLFIPTEIESEMRTCLNLLKNKKNVTVLGLKEWLDFTVIDYPIWDKLNIHYGTKFYIQNNDSTIIDLRIRSRYKFKGEPSKYFYIAYDEMMFFGEALKAFGSQFPKYVRDRKFSYLHNSFNFMEKKGFYENESVNLIWFKEFEPVKIND